MKKIIKLINQGSFTKVYDFLDQKLESYSLENLLYYGGNANAKNLFIFLAFSIAKQETIDKYVTMCDLLEYMEQFIDDNYSLIHWYANKAIDSFVDSIEMKKWVVETYYTSPTSPFSNYELKLYAQDILIIDKEHKPSITIINQKNNTRVDSEC